ncbi:hypothetical protein, conserved [Leishmania donovani]|uniref:Zinc finger, C3HC4 type (RING finger) containing protein, putative n=1 Tax=Leishmania donovani TaxID=5661 RepID=E9BUB0_LEIDO|nr:hypothetical protein, conserved [Leishmania donovani]AYU83757.1 Zinc finger, C3HC4 type (RING finger) containing protein, putative [Leishmania donovani]CBZ38839.1 hypothetical protein, conserved [Leishmania donovani]
MGCCCCYPSDFRAARQASSPLQRRPSSVEHRSFEQNVFHRAKQPAKTRYICDLCGVEVDPTLFDGHQEVCRTNHLRTILAKNAALLSHANIQPSSSAKFHDDAASGDKELCLVCMDRPRSYAFLPCGHISCCQECTKSLDQCPLCRQPREGLCHVSPNVTAQYECKHCHELIAPTLFDGHREVCGLRQRQTQREAEEAAAAAAAAAVTVGVPVEAAENSATWQNSTKSMPSRSPPQAAVATPPDSMLSAATAPARNPTRSLSHVCLECGKTYGQLVVCVPCGHRVLCYTCSQKRTTCPVCVSEIRDIIVAFD